MDEQHAVIRQALDALECMSVADLPKNPSEQWYHLKSSEVIAKHFGVEEWINLN
jgi:hypothetical protein